LLCSPMARPVLAAAGCLAVLALSCPASAPLAAPAAPPPPRLCDFDASLCTGWTVGGTGMWRRGSSTPSTSTGPVRGEGGTQYFMFLETSQGNQGDESHLHSPFFTGVSNVSFFYHMYGSSMGSLSVETHSGRTNCPNRDPNRDPNCPNRDPMYAGIIQAPTQSRRLAWAISPRLGQGTAAQRRRIVRFQAPM
jgi:hypothetical protein